MTTLEILVILGYQVLACPEHGGKTRVLLFSAFLGGAWNRVRDF